MFYSTRVIWKLRGLTAKLQ